MPTAPEVRSVRGIGCRSLPEQTTEDLSSLSANHGGTKPHLGPHSVAPRTSPTKPWAGAAKTTMYVWHIKGLQSSASVSNIGCQDLFEEHLLRASLWHHNLLPKMPTKLKRGKPYGASMINIATGETPQAITPFHFFNYFNFSGT